MKPIHRLLREAKREPPPRRLRITPDEITAVAEDLARHRSRERRTLIGWVRRIVEGKVAIRGIRIFVDRT